MSKIPHIHLDHDDFHLAGIGKVSVAWSYLEGGIERTIWVAGRFSEQRGLAVTTHMSIPARLDAMCSMVRLAFPNSDLLEQVTKQRKHIQNNLAPRRNEIVHSRLHYLKDLEAYFRSTYKARGEVKAMTEKAELMEYEEAAKEILKTTNEMMDTLNQLIEQVAATDGVPPPWPNRP